MPTTEVSDTVHVDALSAWADDEASRRHSWDLYTRGRPPGVGYDPVHLLARRPAPVPAG
ncbi:hypothetical protein [Streptomyces sp. NPDC057302]|uniref:hypothetical protein n=1 Tax=Streptomyces sp. NPDC057302 TaxID=3346094 RepID=UPI003629BFB1